MNSLGGYQVTPIVGLIPSGIDYHANDAEVDDILKCLYLMHYLYININISILSVLAHGDGCSFTGIKIA